MQEKQSQVCQWCLSEIIWDEEVGPETHCPHCENELSAYRSVQVGLARGEEQENSRDDSEEEDWQEEEEGPDTSWMNDENGFRGGNRSLLAAEGVIQRIIDNQLEVPECPACREYMIETGTQIVGGDRYQPSEPQAIGISVLPNPYTIHLYVCPSCYHTASFLSPRDREEMVSRLEAHS
ncbi:hypothetical protein D3P07_03745 [Paenibacillus sp. 1011MAR3C5]|uniref:hypothetical protein n=1 Tax=Paenibacillus sp. 1011MAR3C5 TaxID=1675787 RepID=UPI000E6C5786|nr:hypothetical protein [Paenibacillus sp. 1011MAR3C5]RJE91187.1 hypothetical protein D3P07_03745 [Paenibacillus sp. 1011MAR3C5]